MWQISDLAKWDENFYTGRVGGRRFVELMTTPGLLRSGTPVIDPSIATGEYAFGLTTVQRYSDKHPLRAVMHPGRYVGFTAQLLRFPDLHLSVAVLCNGADETMAPDFADEVAELSLEGKTMNFDDR